MLLTSCKFFRNLTASSYSTENHHQKTLDSIKGKNVQFLDHIEVTPGKTVSSQHILRREKRRKRQEVVEISQVAPSVKMIDLEKADRLQFKYAVLMDISIEELNNITLLQKIDEWWGTPYSYGGNSKSGIDCSAFTQTMMQDVYSLKVPRTAQEQYDACAPVEENDLKEGDLVFFHGTGGRRAPSISHVGLYIGNNKFVHAANNGVTINDLNDNFYRKHFAGGGRVK